MRDRPSRTAIKVAKGLAYLAEDERLAALLPPGAGRWNRRLLTAAGYLKPWHLGVYRRPLFRGYVAFWEHHIANGQILNIGMRKRFLDDETRQALAEGTTQVLVVGAGLDTLAPRLAAEFPEASFVEIDHPATQAVKRAALETLGDIAPNLHLLPVDLAKADLAGTLRGLGAWSPEAPSVVIAEGLLMYLPETAVSGFLATARHQTAPGSRLLFTYVRRDRHGRIYLGKGSGLMRIGFELLGEPMRWGLRDGELESFLEHSGYRLLPPLERLDLRRRYLEPAGLGDKPLGGIELMAAAESVDNRDA